ncbi:MAG: DNA-directed RNA polymerase subunit beta [candidate division CPR1 bacterium ADurb.Bin160]|uniref:DNA-directed RNA polymerase n=1 Tax=candidate division CPR1 bacterium ADurb.Bin160 TaxID=1852826 RepID=A0A1V5ZN73_9BACT|nr:MAG: DNA-directed RNA polymerase subunit beta [candidate division CPR1 bacterium ADurb.Bin160]
MIFKNPYYSLEEDNIFNLRKKEYDSIPTKVRRIIRPIEEMGFELTDFKIKDVKNSSFELQKTIKDNFIIKFKNENHIIDLSFYIPRLIDNNYFIINGMRKVPLFQLFDIPMVEKNNILKIRTNIFPISLIEKEEIPRIRLNILKKSIPLALILFCYYGPQSIIKRFDLDNINIQGDGNTQYEKLLMDLKEYFESSKDYTKDDFLAELGRHFTNTRIIEDPKQKAIGFLYILDLILQCDIDNERFFETGNVLEEIINILKNNKKFSDIDLINRRIRFIEYIILSEMIKTVFDFYITNKDKKKPKFNINSNRVISNCNVSDIVQFDFSINPIDELTKLSRVTLLGPGGFGRENVPEHLRDMHESMFGRICVVDTPDRDNCGVLHCLLPNTKLDENLKFDENVLEKQIISPAVSLVPFLSNNDQTRLQMAASQMRQSIMLKNFDDPIVSSGCEGLYTKETQFIKYAKKDGEVVYIDTNFIIVKYVDNSTDIFDISYRKIFVGNMDFYIINVKQGDKFKKGDILAESNFSHNGNIVFGKNLLTAIMPFYGYNYEDGIIISEELVKNNSLTSVHYEDLSFTLPSNKLLLTLNKENYKPIPSPGDFLDQNEPYAIIREFNENDFNRIFGESLELKAKKRIYVTECNIYANEWNKETTEFKTWVELKINSQREEEKKFLKNLKNHFSNEDFKKIIKEKNLNKFGKHGKYKIKGEEIKGIYFEIFGVYFRKIQIGDKLGNRHGNKGVISNIYPKEKMPRLPDGKPIEIIINPLGIISRMNVGQLYELHMSVVINDLKNILMKKIEDGENQTQIKEYLKEFISIIDNTENGWFSNQFFDQIPEIIDENFVNEIKIIQPPFESTNYEKLMKAKKFTNSKFKQKLFDPASNNFIQNEISVGHMYFFKMTHIAEEKLAARGIGPYTKRTLQPLKGKKNRGGQRLGEMEVSCLIAHDAKENLKECLTKKSDSIDLKNEWLKNEINPNPFIKNEDIDETIESTRILESYLTVIGVDKND